MINAILLGILEGLTEFLPVSSTGHLILFGKLLQFDGDFSKVFDVVIQIGAIFAVIIYFWRDLLPKNLEKENVNSFVSLWSKVVVGVIPAATFGLALESVIDKYLFKPLPVAIALIVGALGILLVDKEQQRSFNINSMAELSYTNAFKIGCFQVLALIPGMSRSAMTIIGGLMMGTSRKLAAEFSFFMAIPVLAGAGLLKLFKYAALITAGDWQVLAVGTFVSFVVAYFVIAAFMQYIKGHTFKVFAYYRLILGLVVIVVSIF